eukprot:scaffold3065_cov389-Prasinococcus_capsulatus_cf.AAC.1
MAFSPYDKMLPLLRPTVKAARRTKRKSSSPDECTLIVVQKRAWHTCDHHRASSLSILLRHLLWPVHHRQRTRDSITKREEEDESGREEIAVKHRGHVRLFEAAHHEEGNKSNTGCGKDPKILARHSLLQANESPAQHLTHIEQQKDTNWQPEG